MNCRCPHFFPDFQLLLPFQFQFVFTRFPYVVFHSPPVPVSLLYFFSSFIFFPFLPLSLTSPSVPFSVCLYPFPLCRVSLYPTVLLFSIFLLSSYPSFFSFPFLILNFPFISSLVFVVIRFPRVLYPSLHLPFSFYSVFYIYSLPSCFSFAFLILNFRFLSLFCVLSSASLVSCNSLATCPCFSALFSPYSTPDFLSTG